ncbi:substrate-binding domain-containing protein [Nonomuraea dietziae]|uniref:substrate-binding domain-containing protein n=1 Tax=Nonomuraea dietziae TaxID=65515 RepID=UPI0031DA7B27
MTNLLQSHPDVTGVFAENDEMALGAIKALGAKAGSAVKVVGFDGTPDGLKAVQAGTLAATVAQQPKVLGQQAIAGAVKAAKGESIQQTVGRAGEGRDQGQRLRVRELTMDVVVVGSVQRRPRGQGRGAGPRPARP